jgi:hypothetical protein
MITLTEHPKEIQCKFINSLIASYMLFGRVSKDALWYSRPINKGEPG